MLIIIKIIVISCLISIGFVAGAAWNGIFRGESDE